MSALPAGLDAELQKPAITAFCAVEILLPGYSLRLVDGPGVLTLFGNAYTGRDATYGVLGALEAISDGVDQSAPALKVTLLPPTETATATLADPAAQGSQFVVYTGAVNPATGLPVSDPYLWFFGELDVPVVLIGRNSRALEYDVVSGLERFFDQDEGVRLNGPWHNDVWTGELGCQFVVNNQDPLPWGQDAPRPVLRTDMPSAWSPGAYAGAGDPYAFRAALRRVF
jgi:hypothetical protein